jgi:hypothetical protein
VLVVDPFGLRESDSMSPTTTCIVAALYIVACLRALAGIAVTLSVFFRHNHDGTANIETRLVIGHKLPDHKYPGGWGYAGPVLIALSVITGLTGNLIWLLSS